MKIENDKYYTPVYLANACWEKTKEYIDFSTVTEIIEPSCGDGSFFHYEKKPNYGYDIEPMCSYENVIKADFLELPLAYMKGRLIIGNPPYGNCLHMARQFFQKSTEIADYIAFILPIGQQGNTHSLYQFDLIHSEDLGKHVYSGRELHCCFNIFKRPESGLNAKPKRNLKAVSIYREDQKGFKDALYDMRICYWGDGSAGKILKPEEHYAAEYKIVINDEKHRAEILEVLESFNWKEYLNCIAMRKIQKFHIIDVLIENVNGIE